LSPVNNNRGDPTSAGNAGRQGIARATAEKSQVRRVLAIVAAVAAGQAMEIDRVSEIATAVTSVEGAAVEEDVASVEEEVIVTEVDIHRAEMMEMIAEVEVAAPPTVAGIEVVRGLGLKTAGAGLMTVNALAVERRATSE